MTRVDLYIRVSTDEQADKGYSQRYQEEILRKYCEFNHLQVGSIVFEDYSARSFDRPEWQKLLANCKKFRGQTQQILFTKWDRFSRNTGDAYQMISTLSNLGIKLQAIEQPLDLEIPEQKMMLAFYLAAPEVENDRRALNTLQGMRRGKKEGRHMGTAPIGYTNAKNEFGKKIIQPKQPMADLVKWSYEEVVKDVLAANQIRQLAVQKGLKISSSQFYNMIRNPIYCGYIKIDAYKDEEAHLVKGQHEAIVSEELFYDVQDVLLKRRRNKRKRAAKVNSVPELPLRGHLVCPKCGRILTGSASRSAQKNLYFYYHCLSQCGFRFRADKANNIFEEQLASFRLTRGKELYIAAIQDSFNSANKESKTSYDQNLKIIQACNEKVSKARDLFLEDKLDSTDFQAIKASCQEEIRKSERVLSTLAGKKSNLKPQIESALSAVNQLDGIYKLCNTEGKREIISSIFPDKLVYEGDIYRTSRINSVIECIYTVNQSLRKTKKSDFSALSYEVAPLRIELRSSV